MKAKKKFKFLDIRASFIKEMLVSISVCAIIVCTLLSSIITVRADDYIHGGVENTVKNIALKNGQFVELKMTETITAATNFNKYFEENYSLEGEEVMSILGNYKVSAANRVIEEYFRNYAKQLVDNNDLLTAFSLYLEPNVMGKNFNDCYRNMYYNDMTDPNPNEDPANHFTRANYEAVLSSGAMNIGKPIHPDERTLIVVMVPMKLKGKTVGVIQLGYNLSYFQENLLSDDFKTIDSEIMKSDGTVLYIANDEKLTLGSNYRDSYSTEKTKSLYDSAISNALSNKTTSFNSVDAFEVFVPITINGEKWVSTTSVGLSEINSYSSSLVKIAVTISIFCIILLIVIIGVLVRKLIKPLNDSVNAIEDMARGKLDTRIEVKTRDEFARLATSYNQSMTNLQGVVEDIDVTLNEISNGNLSVTFDREYEGDFGSISDSLKNIIVSLRSTLSQITTASSEVAHGASQISNASQTLAQGATEQASSVAELSATIENVADQVKSTSDKAHEANANIENATNELNTANSHMNDLMSAMEETKAQSEQISKVVKTIEDIAFQTNILALNAAVEAARAGAAGKGFAVVADEVRNLANKSSEASKTTSQLIEATTEAIGTSHKLAKESSDYLTNAVSSNEVVLSNIKDIQSESERQSEAINQIVVGIEQINSVVSMNSATSEECAASSEELSSQAATLDELMATFTLEEPNAVTAVKDSCFKNAKVKPVTIKKEVKKETKVSVNATPKPVRKVLKNDDKYVNVADDKYGL